jgi:hypothetical protein
VGNDSDKHLLVISFLKLSVAVGELLETLICTWEVHQLWKDSPVLQHKVGDLIYLNLQCLLLFWNI